MPRTITVSLPVADLKASVKFYAALGFKPNPAMSNEAGANMIWSETISVMLLSHSLWKTFTDRPICPKTSSEVAFNISCESRAQVDAMNKAAGENGGAADVNPVQEHGSMYGRDFTDPDGHVWGAFWAE